jgi:hypothetical protein
MHHKKKRRFVIFFLMAPKAEICGQGKWTDGLIAVVLERLYCL